MEFRVLGPLEAVAEGKALALGGETQRKVLAVLVLRAREVVPVDAIVEAVWGPNPPATAVGLVRTYVSRLRKAFSVACDADDLLATRPPGYVLEAAPEQVDATRFEQLAGRARQEAAADRFEAALATLEEALGLWRGGVLADITGSDWLRPAASRFEQMRLAALEDRVDARLALGHHAEVVPELEALTAGLPFRERLWGQLIVALYRTGRQADALSAYQTVRSVLAGQLGIAPGPDLQALEQDILQQAPDLAWGPEIAPRHPAPGPAAVATPIPLPPALFEGGTGKPLVGRNPERALLRRSLETARTGQFGGVLVSGPPGIGKTALVAAFAREAHAGGAAVLHGRADEGAALPFQSVREALCHWAASASVDELGLLGEEDTARLARIVTALDGRIDGLSPAPDEGSEADRHLLLEAIARWVAVLAASGPAVVVLDDLHWADQATLLVVRHLLRHPPAAGALLIAAYRDTELSGRNGLAGLLASTRGDRRVTHMELGGLADGEVAELVRAEAGRDLSRSGKALATQINHRAGGNPLFIHETLRHLIERGDIVPAANQWGDGALIQRSGVPGGVQEVIEQRLARLPEASTSVLRQAAVVGEHFGLPVLSRIVGTSQVAVVEALEPAVAAGLVTQLGSHADRFAFSHALVREAIFERLSLSQRARAHWEAGRAIASLHASHLEPHLGEIAHHLAMGVSAGDRHMAISANVDAGWQALEALAFEDALTRFRTATDLLEAAGTVDPEVAYAAWFGLAQSAIANGSLGDPVRDGLLRSAAIAREQKWGRRLAQAAIGFSTSHARHGSQADIAVAEGLVDEALATLDDSGTAARALLLGIKATIAGISGRSDDARELANSVISAGGAVGSGADPTAQASTRLAHCWMLLGGPHPEEIGRLAEQVLAHRGPLRARFFLYSSALGALAVSSVQRGDRAAFEAVRARVGALPETRHSSYLADFMRLWDIGLALASGRFGEVENMLTSVSFAGSRSAWDEIVTFHVALAGIERGRHHPVRDYLGQLLRSAPEASLLRALLALLDAEAGEAADATRQVDALRQGHRDWRPGDLGPGAPFFYRCVPEVAARLHDAELAADLLPGVTEYSGQMLVSYAGMMIHAAADRAIGQLLLVLGRYDEAVEHMEVALELEQSFGADALAARTRYWHARARLAREAPGDASPAHQLLQRAAADARRLGMAQLQQDAESLLASGSPGR